MDVRLHSGGGSVRLKSLVSWCGACLGLTEGSSAMCGRQLCYAGRHGAGEEPSERLFERGMRAVGQMAEAFGCLQGCSPPSALLSPKCSGFGLEPLILLFPL